MWSSRRQRQHRYSTSDTTAQAAHVHAVNQHNHQHDNHHRGVWGKVRAMQEVTVCTMPTTTRIATGKTRSSIGWLYLNININSKAIRLNIRRILSNTAGYAPVLFLNDWCIEYLGILQLNSGQAGCSNSLWLLNYRQLADSVVANFRSNDVFGWEYKCYGLQLWVWIVAVDKQ